MKKSTIQANSLQCRAMLDGNSFNKEARTIEVVFATETPVKRWNWELGEYMEVLEISTKAIDFSRMQAGAPVLNTHSRWTLTDVIGVVEKAWVDTAKKEARALLRFTSREDIQPTIDDIESGIIRNVSVGYTVSEYTVENADKPNQEYRATKWTPAEISFVPIPADYNSGARSGDRINTNTITILNSNLMEGQENPNERSAGAGENQQTTATTAAPATAARGAATTPAAVVTPTDTRAEGVIDERTRSTTILETCTRAGLSNEFALNLMSTNVSLSDARAAIIDEVSKRSNPAPTNQGAKVTGTDERDQIREAAIAGLLHRSAPGSINIKDNERAQIFGNMRMLDVAKDCLRAAGINHSLMSEPELVKRALTTTDLPNILSAAFTRSLRRYYDAVVPDWKPFARQETANDFREKTGIKVDGSVTFEEIPENGEYEETNVLQDEAAKIKLRKFGRKHSISDIAIINDDLSVLSRIPQIMALGAQQMQSNAVWNLIINNAKAPDGLSLFHANHKNLAAAGVLLDEDGLTTGRTSMRRQKSPAGNLLGIKPKFLIVPPELETTAQKLVTAVLSTATGDVNVFAGKLQNVVADYLTDPKAWYMAADPNETTADGLVYSYLTGREGLHVEQRVNFDTDALEVKASMFFASAVWGHQGWWKSPGQ